MFNAADPLNLMARIRAMQMQKMQGQQGQMTIPPNFRGGMMPPQGMPQVPPQGMPNFRGGMMPQSPQQGPQNIPPNLLAMLSQFRR